MIENSTKIKDNESALKYPLGRLLALDLGEKRIGVAVSDERRISVRALPVIQRTSWKQLLVNVRQTIVDFDAQGLVIGLPLHLDGSESIAATEARRSAVNFGRSLQIPVFLQDERLTSHAAETNLRADGYGDVAVRSLVDSASAAIILRDFIQEHQDRNFESHSEETI